MPRYLHHALLLLLTCAVSIDAREHVEGYFSENLKRPGYYLVTIIPEGATSINVTELSRTRNFLAVKIHNGPYLFNENNNIGWSSKYSGAGTNFTYTRRRHDQLESFYSLGPLSTSIDVMLVHGEGKPNVFFTYELPIDFKSTTSDGSNSIFAETQDLQFSSTTQLLSKTSENLMMGDEMRSSTTMATPRARRKRMKFVWKSARFSSCSRSCGGGFQTKQFICINKKTNHHVSDKKCGHSAKPTTVPVRCNSVPCPPQWEAGPWSKCSVTCGNGTRTRELQCIQEMSERLQISVNSQLCPKERVTKIPLKESCFMPDCQLYTAPKSNLPIMKNASPRWKVAEWTPCSSTCGYGKRIRSVTCIPRGKACNPRDKPVSEEKCNLGSCKTRSIEENLIPEDYTDSIWLFSEWPEKCPNECGNGTMTRRLYCEAILKNKTCGERNMPEHTMTCNNTDVCSGKWFTGPWSQCSSSCDVGMETREVVCVSFFLGSPKVVKNINCLGERPETTRICKAPPCNATWFMSDWSECSRSCGGGSQQRTVKCLAPDGTAVNASKTECATVKKPPSKRSCNEIKCRHTNLDEANAITNADDNSVDEMCQDTLPDCSNLRSISKEAKHKCQTNRYKQGCCRACQYVHFVSNR